MENLGGGWYETNPHPKGYEHNKKAFHKARTEVGGYAYQK